MPLRDHFRPPLESLLPWEGFQATWPVMIVARLRRLLPRRYLVLPRVHSGSSVEIDVATFRDEGGSPGVADHGNGNTGGVATAVWAPPPTTAPKTNPRLNQAISCRTPRAFAIAGARRRGVCPAPPCRGQTRGKEMRPLSSPPFCLLGPDGGAGQVSTSTAISVQRANLASFVKNNPQPCTMAAARCKASGSSNRMAEATRTSAARSHTATVNGNI